MDDRSTAVRRPTGVENWKTARSGPMKTKKIGYPDTPKRNKLAIRASPPKQKEIDYLDPRKQKDFAIQTWKTMIKANYPVAIRAPENEIE